MIWIPIPENWHPLFLISLPARVIPDRVKSSPPRINSLPQHQPGSFLAFLLILLSIITTPRIIQPTRNIYHRGKGGKIFPKVELDQFPDKCHPNDRSGQMRQWPESRSCKYCQTNCHNPGQRKTNHDVILILAHHTSWTYNDLRQQKSNLGSWCLVYNAGTWEQQLHTLLVRAKCVRPAGLS